MTLKAKLDGLLSEYIRRKERGVCYSCGTKKHWKEMDAGHYIKRGCWRLRYDERNVHCQCRKCNRFMGGNMGGYAIHLEKDYGYGILQELKLIEDMPQKSYKPQEIKDLIKHYQDKISNL